ncbi:uncharacterized protein LOC106672390 isoform X2 [Cimex lectularius]|uniref:Uncharacterized protein n=1 Tax=Cimex lectularius TaxID=79782 RepID=A0A8I6SC71_CIMLE|nr:uncharacterized protein LOC106672390 isoform X2 [Cimex lectularius]
MMTEEKSIEDVSDSSYTTVESSDSEPDSYNINKYNKGKWCKSRDWGALAQKQKRKKGELDFQIPLSRNESENEYENLSYYGNEPTWNAISSKPNRIISITARTESPKVGILKDTEGSKANKLRNHKVQLKEKYVGLNMLKKPKKGPHKVIKVNEAAKKMHRQKVSEGAKDFLIENDNLEENSVTTTKALKPNGPSNKKSNRHKPTTSRTNPTAFSDSSSSHSPIPSVSKRHPARKSPAARKHSVTKKKTDKKKSNEKNMQLKLKISSVNIEREFIKGKKPINPKRVSFQPDMVEVVSFNDSEDSKEYDVSKHDHAKEINQRTALDSKENTKKLGAMTPERAERIKNFYKDWAKKPRRTENMKQEKNFLALKKIEISDLGGKEKYSPEKRP